MAPTDWLIDKATFERTIADKALGLWNDFAESNKDLALLALDKTRWHFFAKRFLSYVAEISLTRGYQGGAQIVYASNLHSKLRAPSWLLHSGGDVPHILVDREYIKQKVTDPEYPKIVSRLIIHEIGHLAMHWYRLRQQTGKPVESATAAEEQQAWTFCGVILGLGLALKAVSGRSNGTIDDAWPSA